MTHHFLKCVTPLILTKVTLTQNSIWSFNIGHYPGWPGEEDHQADQWLQRGEWGQGAHIRQTYEQEVAGKDTNIPLTRASITEWCIQVGFACACRTFTQLCRSSTLRGSTLRKRWRVVCCTGGISTLLWIGSALISKMVTECHHLSLTLETIRLSELTFFMCCLCTRWAARRF